MEATTVAIVTEIPKPSQGGRSLKSDSINFESATSKPLGTVVTAADAKAKHGGGSEKFGDRTTENATKKSFVVSSVSSADCKSSSGDSLTSILPPKKKKNRVQVSKNKKSFVFYLNLAKRYLKMYNDVELSALGMAIPTVVTIAEILKRSGRATEKGITISTVISPKEDQKGRQIQKAKIEIVLENVEKLDKTSAAVATVQKAKIEIVLENVEKLDKTSAAIVTDLKKDSDKEASPAAC